MLNVFMMQYIFQVPFFLHLLFNIFLIICIFLGSKLQIIGLTGGIATGKSTVSEILSQNNFDIIDADKISH
jgi:dephospho-CoA kinase